jgi:uncharacterized protein YjbI with pentapeptide repeats
MTTPREDTLDLFTDHLEPEGDYDRLLLDARDLVGADAESARFIECLLRGCDLDQAVLDHAHVVDTTITESRAGVLRARSGTWRDVTVRDCRFGAVEVFGSSWDRVTIEGGKLDYLNLRDARVQDLRFVGCTIGDLDLAGARVRQMSFEGCRVGRLDVTRAQLGAVDLRGAELAGLDGTAGLKGATISPQQLLDLAGALAEHLGVTVR